MNPLIFLGENPAASDKEIMDACGCSRRAARHAREQLRLEQGKPPRYVKPLLAISFLLAIGLIALQSRLGDGPTQPARSSGEVLAQEAAIYSALDARDASQARRISEHLSSPQEPLRLAALRFVASVDPLPYLGRLTPLVDDDSKRVRAAAIQLLGRSTGLGPGQTGVTAKLVEVLGDSSRELSERVLALAGLRQRKPADLRALLPVLDEPRLAAQLAELLLRWSGRSVEVSEGESLRTAWERELGANG